MRLAGALTGTAFVLALCAAGAAGYKDTVGHTQLSGELGPLMPTGAGVPVTQVEATDVDGNYMVNTALAEFSGKTISQMSSRASGSSTHANKVGTAFYGNTQTAPGITSVHVYLTRYSISKYWMGSEFLKVATSGSNPAISANSSRIINHSWADTLGTNDSELLRRVDFVVEQDDLIQVAAVNNGTTVANLPSAARNVIAVGLDNGAHAQGTNAIDADYPSGRAKPEIVTPAYMNQVTSYASPVVGAAAALLVETAHDGGLTLSNGSYVGGRTGLTIYHAETSEVIKASLMAGAERFVADYGEGANQTTNGLDKRYGAGRLNVYNSYHIIAGAEQDGYKTSVPDPIDIDPYGFDYEPSLHDYDAVSYFFTPGHSGELAASLVWNAKITGVSGGSWQGTMALYDLNLYLYDVTTPQSPVLVASSTSTIENSENIYYEDLTAGRDYKLVVDPANSPSFTWDYGLAWRYPVPEPATAALVAVGALALLRRRRS